MKKVVFYGRVSTQSQEWHRQVEELRSLAQSKGWVVAKVFTEKISGVKKNTERKELSNMMEYIDKNNISKVLVTELSRLGRNTLQVLESIETLNDRGVSLYIQNYSIETLNEDGSVNAMAQFLITILAEVARMERGTIRERMASGYRQHIKNGGSVGRRRGYRKSDDEMKIQYREVIKLLNNGYSLVNIHKLTGVSINTIKKCRVYV